MAYGSLPSRTLYWLIARGASRAGDGAWNFEALSIRVGDEEFLMVFTDEGRAEMFAWLMVLEGSRGAVYEDFEGRSSVIRDLQPRPCSGGELVSLLMGGASGGGPCASVEKVALDPSPEILFDESFDGLDFDVSHMSREGFIEKLIVQGHTKFESEREEKGV